MADQPAYLIVSSDGVRGRGRPQEGDSSLYLIEFPNYPALLVRKDLLNKLDDKSYTFPYSLAKLTQSGNQLIMSDRGTQTTVAQVVDLANTSGSAKTFNEGDNRSLATGQEQIVIPVIEEQADIQKRMVDTGAKVRITKVVNEQEVVIDEPLLKEEVNVDRVKVERLLDEPVKPHYQGDTLIIPVFEEVLVVEKRLMLREELHITKRRVTQPNEPESITLRKEEVKVERIEGQPPDTGPAIKPDQP